MSHLYQLSMTAHAVRTPPEGMDSEIVDLFLALNRLRGVRTMNSCCGHGKERFWIMIDTTPARAMAIRRALRPLPHWTLRKTHFKSPIKLPPFYLLLGPKGAAAYCEAKQIALRLSRMPPAMKH